MQILRLSGEQKERLLDLRKLHLRNLRALYEDRQRLNLQVGCCPVACCCLNRSNLLSGLTPNCLLPGGTPLYA